MARLRIIGGHWRSLHLPVADRPGLRPTSDRVRETLFNWLGQDLTGWRVLDAFAGAGGLGFEAASRGAARVCMVESDARAAQALVTARKRLGAAADDLVQIVRADALVWMRDSAARHGPFDLVLLDPPFASGLLAPALALLREAGHEKGSNGTGALLAQGGVVYVESAEVVDAAWLVKHGLAQAGSKPGDFTVCKHGRAGAVHYHLLAIRHEGEQERTAW